MNRGKFKGVGGSSAKGLKVIHAKRLVPTDRGKKMKKNKPGVMMRLLCRIVS